MSKEIRMNTLYNDLYKSLKTCFVPYTIILTLPSEKATDCAYNGIDYTIRDVVTKLREANCNIRIEDYNVVSDEYKYFHLYRNNNTTCHNINMKVYKINKNNQILFEIYVSIVLG